MTKSWKASRLGKGEGHTEEATRNTKEEVEVKKGKGMISLALLVFIDYIYIYFLSHENKRRNNKVIRKFF